MDTTKNKKQSEIKGWGIDADPENEPTYPIKDYTGDDHKRSGWERPTLQHSDVEMLQSNERPSKSAVFGTVAPPSGLSGMIRRRAFKHSENLYRHWLPLILADKINVIEGIIDDLVHARFPDLAGEAGWKALWKYNKSSLVRKMAGRVVIVSAIVALIMYANRKNK